MTPSDDQAVLSPVALDGAALLCSPAAAPVGPGRSEAAPGTSAGDSRAHLITPSTPTGDGGVADDAEASGAQAQCSIDDLMTGLLIEQLAKVGQYELDARSRRALWLSFHASLRMLVPGAGTPPTGLTDALARFTRQSIDTSRMTADQASTLAEHAINRALSVLHMSPEELALVVSMDGSVMPEEDEEDRAPDDPDPLVDLTVVAESRRLVVRDRPFDWSAPSDAGPAPQGDPFDALVQAAPAPPPDADLRHLGRRDGGNQLVGRPAAAAGPTRTAILGGIVRGSIKAMPRWELLMDQAVPAVPRVVASVVAAWGSVDPPRTQADGYKAERLIREAYLRWRSRQGLPGDVLLDTRVGSARLSDVAQTDQEWHLIREGLRSYFTGRVGRPDILDPHPGPGVGHVYEIKPRRQAVEGLWQLYGRYLFWLNLSEFIIANAVPLEDPVRHLQAAGWAAQACRGVTEPADYPKSGLTRPARVWTGGSWRPPTWLRWDDNSLLVPFAPLDGLICWTLKSRRRRNDEQAAEAALSDADQQLSNLASAAVVTAAVIGRETWPSADGDSAGAGEAMDAYFGLPTPSSPAPVSSQPTAAQLATVVVVVAVVAVACLALGWVAVAVVAAETAEASLALSATILTEVAPVAAEATAVASETAIAGETAMTAYGSGLPAFLEGQAMNDFAEVGMEGLWKRAAAALVPLSSQDPARPVTMPPSR